MCIRDRSTEYFGFQVGESANDRNCNYGAGGWFAYEGFLNGTAIQGGTGDVLLDLECSEEINNACGDQESTVTLYYSAWDEDCGDVILGSETYTREDTEAPDFDNAPEDVTVDCAVGLPEVPVVTVTDNCEGSDATAPTIVFSESPAYNIECTGSYTVSRTWLATDCSGNSATHTQYITVEDNTAPTITGGSDYEAECDGSGNAMELSMWLSSNGGASATDDCGTVSWSHDYNDGDLSDGCGATGTVDVTFTAADDCGNESDITLTFTIEDETAPTLNVTSAVVVACETYSATGIYGATATDICGGATVELVSVTDVSSGCPQYLHVYNAVEDCGNESATIDQVVSLVDEEDPVVNIACPANYAAYLDGDCLTDISPAAAGTATATATDNCSTPTPTVTYSDGTPTPGCGNNYSFVRTWSATAQDECGNSTTVTCDQTVTVSDEIDPVITCPADVTVECDGMGNAADLATFLAGASATDNCDMDVDITNNFTALSNGCGATGNATVTFTATDDCGNTSTCLSLIHI